MSIKLSNIFIRNNNTRNKPKKTEILNLFDTFITEQKDKKPTTFFNKSKSHFSIFKSKHNYNSKFSYFPKKILTKKLSNKESSNENSKTISTQVDNMKTILNKSNISGIKQIILPQINSIYDYNGNLDYKFYLPEQANKLSCISKIIAEKKFNSQIFHDFKTNFLINKGVHKMKLVQKKIDKILKEEKNIEEILEEKDKFFDEDLKVKKFKQIILNFLKAKDNKLNQLQIFKPEFYNSIENKFNFLYDCYKVPHLKNHFIDFSSKLFRINKYPNIIDHGIVYYLNVLKYSIQRKNDEEKNLKNISGNRYIEKKLSKREIEAEKMNFLRFNQEEDKNTKIYELEKFFIHKYSRYNKVNIVNWKMKYPIYNAESQRNEFNKEKNEEIKETIFFENLI